jgi:hypothetical protein
MPIYKYELAKSRISRKAFLPVVRLFFLMQKAKCQLDSGMEACREHAVEERHTKFIRFISAVQ